MPIAKTILAVAVFLLTFTKTYANPSSDYVILNFTAQWCQPCAEMSQAIEQLSQQGWLIRQIDVDREKGLVQRWKVTQLPTLIILQDGLETDRVTGLLSYADLKLRMPKSAEVIRGEAAISSAAPQPISSRAIPSDSSTVDPMQSTVRIKIEDGRSTSFGSGTIIDQHEDEALVLTCGHLFRGIQGQALLTVDVLMEGRLVTMPATVVDFRCDETDIGLIAFRPGRPVAVAALLPHGVTLQEQESVSSFGCDHGADPTRRDSRISKLNRYIGPSNVEVAQAPVQGRSGGGLFNAKGQLIGVCYAADAELDEGLYSGPEVVYQQLARLGLGRLYNPKSNAAQIASIPTPSTSTPLQPMPSPTASPSIAVNSPSSAFPDRSMGDGWKAAIGQAAVAARETIASNVSSAIRGAEGSTLTAILRDVDGNEQRITIPSPSPGLLQALQMQSPSNTVPRIASN